MDNVMAPHIYMSLPASWLFQLRSIWYACEFDNQGHMQSLCLTGNPIILWLGACLLPLACWKIRNKNVAFLLASYSLYYIPWFFSARETQFLYYYFAPSIFLGGLTGVLLKQKQRTWHLAIASLFFIAYLPFALGFPLRTEYRHYWMWPSGWKWSKDS